MQCYIVFICSFLSTLVSLVHTASQATKDVASTMTVHVVQAHKHMLQETGKQCVYVCSKKVNVLHLQAYDTYGYGRTTTTATGVPGLQLWAFYATARASMLTATDGRTTGVLWACGGV